MDKEFTLPHLIFVLVLLLDHIGRIESYRDSVYVTVRDRNPVETLCTQESYNDIVQTLFMKGMTFNALKRKFQQKICLNRGQSITSIICRYPVTVRSGMFNYQAITINDDEDIDGMFDVYNRHECISCFELPVQYEQQPSSITNVETTIASRQIHRTQYTDYHIESYHEGPSS
ncbi:hypothetical protein JHK84_048473 [Glycine max]|nr:hypothetical protein JHK84_048473 [Glycine max]